MPASRTPGALQSIMSPDRTRSTDPGAPFSHKVASNPWVQIIGYAGGVGATLVVLFVAYLASQWVDSRDDKLDTAIEISRETNTTVQELVTQTAVIEQQTKTLAEDVDEIADRQNAMLSELDDLGDRTIKIESVVYRQNGLGPWPRGEE